MRRPLRLTWRAGPDKDERRAVDPILSRGSVGGREAARPIRVRVPVAKIRHAICPASKRGNRFVVPVRSAFEPEWALGAVWRWPGCHVDRDSERGVVALTKQQPASFDRRFGLERLRSEALDSVVCVPAQQHDVLLVRLDSQRRGCPDHEWARSLRGRAVR